MVVDELSALISRKREKIALAANLKVFEDSPTT
jgi:hypothetical protein